MADLRSSTHAHVNQPLQVLNLKETISALFLMNISGGIAT